MINESGAENFTNVTYQYFNLLINCEWSNGSGVGWCERDWGVAEVCMGLNRTDCLDNANCFFSNDTWCSGAGSGNSWCNDFGGWCEHNDFKSKDCWENTDNTSCSGVTGCNWKIDTWSKPHCEINWSGNCWNLFDKTG